MKNRIKNLLGLTNTDKGVVPLVKEEKDNLREEFWRFMDTHPLPTTKERAAFNYSSIGFLSPVPQLAVLVFLVSIVGTTYIADQSAPNDKVLYAVKRNVNEEILKAATSFSPELRAKVDKTLLNRRLGEVEALIVDQAFVDELASRLREDISNHTDSLNEFVSEAEDQGELDTAIEISEDLTTMMEAHNTVVHLLDDFEENASEIQINLLISDLAEDRLTIRRNTETLEGKSGLIIKDDVHKELAELKDEFSKVSEELEAAKEEYASNTDLAEEVEFLLASSQNARASADTDLETGNTENAVKKLKNSVQNMEKATLILKYFNEAVEDNH